MSDSEKTLPDLLPEPLQQRSHAVRVALLAGGSFFVALGVVGWLVPVVTGIPFYIVGFAMLGVASSRVRRWINRAERRLPLRARLALRRRRDA